MTLGIVGAPFRAALAFATVEPRETFDDVLDTDSVDARVGDARIVMFAATVPVGCTDALTNTAETRLPIRATIGAGLLANRIPGYGLRNECGAGDQNGYERAAATGLRYHPRQSIEPVMIDGNLYLKPAAHFFPTSSA